MIKDLAEKAKNRINAKLIREKIKKDELFLDRTIFCLARIISLVSHRVIIISLTARGS